MWKNNIFTHVNGSNLADVVAWRYQVLPCSLLYRDGFPHPGSHSWFQGYLLQLLVTQPASAKGGSWRITHFKQYHFTNNFFLLYVHRTYLNFLDPINIVSLITTLHFFRFIKDSILLSVQYQIMWKHIKQKLKVTCLCKYNQNHGHLLPYSN